LPVALLTAGSLGSSQRLPGPIETNLGGGLIDQHSPRLRGRALQLLALPLLLGGEVVATQLKQLTLQLIGCLAVIREGLGATQGLLGAGGGRQGLLAGSGRTLQHCTQTEGAAKERAASRDNRCSC
jgi:hypothetical protein